MNIKRIFFLNFGVSVLVILFSVLTSCKSSTEANNNGQTVYPDSGLSYSQHIRPIFIEDCATISGCHQSASHAGGLDLETDPPIPSFPGEDGPTVIAFSPSLSNLYLVLFDQVPGVSPRMPPTNVSVSGLEDSKIKAIGTWISEGANTAN
jgi:hypothetical protein